MKFRRLFPAALAVLLAVSSCGAAAQGFNSVSSGKRMPDSPLPPAATVPVPQATPAQQEPGAAVAAQQEPTAVATVPRDAAVTQPAPPPFSSGATAVAPSAAATPAETAETPATAAPQGCEAQNPFLTGSAAAAAEKACALANPFMTGPAASGATAPEAADRVLVKKSERRLYLMRAGRVIAEYPVKLGLSPKGPKEREGDFRTPEGVYELTRRNQYSDFFLSLELSYPNVADRQRAQAFGFKPGGLIMIHGQPNTPRRPPDYYANNDWTDGCIAVSNADMADIWLRTTVGMPVEIRP